jgi:hypothetical protein
MMNLLTGEWFAAEQENRTLRDAKLRDRRLAPKKDTAPNRLNMLRPALPSSPLTFPVAIRPLFRHIAAAAALAVSSGCSSGVEHNLAKVRVEGSNPFARSKFSSGIQRSKRSFGAVFAFELCAFWTCRLPRGGKALWFRRLLKRAGAGGG